jgi:ABC-type multidrug transport system fused ATPase/permease subunit
VLQDTVLFHGTIAENIAYGRSGATTREIRRAAELANVDEFVARMPQALRHHGRRTRRNLVGRPAAADCDRAGR